MLYNAIIFLCWCIDLDFPYKVVVATLVGLLMFSTGLIYISHVEDNIAIETHNTYTTDGVKIVFDVFYEKSEGLKDKPVAITIHGFSSNRRTMKIISLNLAKNGFLVASLDLRGHGDSEGYMLPLGNTSEERRALYSLFEKDVIAVIEWLNSHGYGLTDSLTLIGHSMGGGLAIYLGGRLPFIHATIGISPGLATDFVNTTSPKNLLLIGGLNDKLVPPSYVIDLFYKSINGTGEAGKIYNVDGNFRKLYLDDEADHISIIFDSDVIREILSWSKSFAFGGKDFVMEPPYKILIPVNIVALGGMIILVTITMLISISWNISRKPVKVMEKGRKRYLTIGLPFAIALCLGWLISIILFSIIRIVSPLLMANVASSFIFGGGLGLYIGSKVGEKMGLQGFNIKEKLLNELKGETLWITLRLSAIYPILLIAIFYGSIGVNFISTFSTSLTHNLYLPIIILVILPSSIFYEFYFRDTLKSRVDIGKATPLLSGLINFVLFYLFWLANAWFISIMFEISFWFFVIGLRTLWLPILTIVALSEAIHEYFDLKIPQIVMSTILLSTILLAITPAMIY